MILELALIDQADRGKLDQQVEESGEEIFRIEEGIVEFIEGKWIC